MSAFVLVADAIIQPSSSKAMLSLLTSVSNIKVEYFRRIFWHDIIPTQMRTPVYIETRIKTSELLRRQQTGYSFDPTIMGKLRFDFDPDSLVYVDRRYGFVSFS
jgi:hypothetical protein